MSLDMSSGLTIRAATKDDITSVSEIYKKIHKYEALGKLHTGWLDSIYPTEETAITAYERNDLFVCDSGGSIVACAIINKLQADVYSKCKWSCKADGDKAMVLHTLAVDPERSGQGVGKAFVAFYEKYASENDCTVLRMDTNEKNTVARSLYKKLGYREAGIFPCTFNGIPNVKLVLFEKSLR